MVQIPPFGGGEVSMLGGEVTVRASDVAARAGEAPKSQTTSAKNVEIGVLWARWSVFWAQRRLASCPARTRTR